MEITMMPYGAKGTIAACLFALAGCGLFGRRTDGEGSAAVTPVPLPDAAGGAPGDAQPGDAGQAGASCEGLPGPAMVKVPAPGGAAYCIDSTEVTQAQYAAFLAAVKAAPGSEHAACKSNKTYDPTLYDYDPYEPKDCTKDRFTPLATPNRPVVCVDWCDAYAFCAWAGKRLCGKIGGGSVASLDDSKLATVSQWYNACSQSGTTVYPYGDTFDPNACEVGGTPGSVDAAFAAKKDVGVMTACHGTKQPFFGIHDMSGSVAEFADECFPWKDGFADCVRRGGHYANSVSNSTCVSVGTGLRDYFDSYTGFRCCKDLP